MVDIVGGGGDALRLVCEGRGARESIVGGPDGGRIAERFAPEVGREACGEVLEGGELGADRDAAFVAWRGEGRLLLLLLFLIQDDGEDGLGATGILDGLCGEEEVRWGFGCGRVEGAIEGSGGAVGGGGDVLEQKNEAVDWTARSPMRRVLATVISYGCGVRNCHATLVPQRSNRVRVQRDQLLKLHVFHAKILNE